MPASDSAQVLFSMTAPLFKGVITALITPLRDGNVDEAAFKKLLERQIAAGVHGVVPVGTTGECATLHVEEHKRVIELCVEIVAGRTKVIAGAGANATHEAIALSKFAKEVGADATLVVTPYYNRPSQDGMIQHFEAVADAVQIPMVLYNVPSRCGVDLSNEAVIHLAKHPNIIGIKDATGDMDRVNWLRAHIPDQFDQLSGDDASWLGHIASGGTGVISVSSNIVPEAMVAMYDAVMAGDFATARTWQDRLIGLHLGLFKDNSPAPAKYALSKLGLCDEEARLPIAATRPEVRDLIDQLMIEVGAV